MEDGRLTAKTQAVSNDLNFNSYDKRGVTETIEDMFSTGQVKPRGGMGKNEVIEKTK